MGLDLHAGIDGTPENEYEDTWYAPDLHAHWSYTGFGRFRESLAIHEGFFLNDMAGFTEGGRSWDDVFTTLKPLLDHSDCDGEMTPEEAAQVWPRLAEIAEEWKGNSELEWDLRGMRALIELLQGAAKNGWTVLFRRVVRYRCEQLLPRPERRPQVGRRTARLPRDRVLHRLEQAGDRRRPAPLALPPHPRRLPVRADLRHDHHGRAQADPRTADRRAAHPRRPRLAPLARRLHRRRAHQNVDVRRDVPLSHLLLTASENTQ